MTDDTLFRLLLFIVAVAVVPRALYHRIRSNTGEKLDRWQEGIFILFGLRLGGLPWFAACVAWMINPRWMAWSAMPVPVWMRWFGFLLIGFWGCLLLWTFRHLGKNLTDTVVTRREHTLVTTGPYRFVRHPFYLALAVALVGGSLVAANWFILVSGLIPLGFLVARTRIEEEKLVQRFGDQYRDYMARTGQFVPRPSWFYLSVMGIAVCSLVLAAVLYSPPAVRVEPLTFPHPDEVRRSGDFMVLADRRVFAAMAFLNAVGDDEEVPGEQMHPVRNRVREMVQGNLASEPEKLRRWRRYYSDKEIAYFNYLNVALCLNADYPFRRIRPDEELHPYIARHLRDLPHVLNDFWTAAQLGDIWNEVKPDHIVELEKYDFDRMVKQRDFVWEYLRMTPSDSYKLVAVLNLLDRRSNGMAAHFGSYYYTVESPGAISYDLNVHEYLHGIVNPLVIAHLPGHEAKFQRYAEAGQGGPLAQTYKELTIFTYECLVRALDRRIQMKFDADQSAQRRAEAKVASDTEKGLTLTQPFYDLLPEFERSEISFDRFVPAMLERIPD